MLLKRIIPCLDVDKGRVVKGIQYVDHVDAGDPVEVAQLYGNQIVERIVERIALKPELPLFIKADVAVLYGTVVDLVSKAREAGVEQIGLMVDRQEDRGR